MVHTDGRPPSMPLYAHALGKVTFKLPPFVVSNSISQRYVSLQSVEFETSDGQPHRRCTSGMITIYHAWQCILKVEMHPRVPTSGCSDMWNLCCDAHVLVCRNFQESLSSIARPRSQSVAPKGRRGISRSYFFRRCTHPNFL